MTRAEIIDSFRAEFPDCEVEEEAVFGPMFEILLGEAEQTDRCTVHCAWGILEEPDLMRRIVHAGMMRLTCCHFNPQVQTFYQFWDEFCDDEEGL